MSMRRHSNPGKREREGRKRHRRAHIWCSDMGAEAAPLKLGHKHFQRWMRRDILSVADAET